MSIYNFLLKDWFSHKKIFQKKKNQIRNYCLQNLEIVSFYWFYLWKIFLM